MRCEIRNSFGIFGLTIPVFKVFGGILLVLKCYSPKKPSIRSHDIEPFDESLVTSPLAIPILAGPGKIVRGMNFVAAANYLPVLIMILIFALFTFLTYQGFRYSEHLVKLFGKRFFSFLVKLPESFCVCLEPICYLRYVPGIQYLNRVWQ